MSDNFNFSKYDGEREYECTLLARSIILTRRRIQKHTDSNKFSLASRARLLSAISHLNSLLEDIFDTYEEEFMDIEK